MEILGVSGSLLRGNQQVANASMYWSQRSMRTDAKTVPQETGPSPLLHLRSGPELSAVTRHPQCVSMYQQKSAETVMLHRSKTR